MRSADHGDTRGDPGAAAWAAAETAARTSYGRLVATLTAGTDDLALAQDVLSVALERALVTWPVRGVPDRPDAWLLTVARNARRDVWKSAAHRTRAPLDEALDLTLAQVDHDDVVPDERLELLFLCAHPALAENVRAALLLHAVLGFEAAQIARAVAVPAGTMAQRLVRAKRRVRDTGLRFRTPTRADLPERLPTVLEAVYGCLALGREAEARHLARTLAELLDGAELGDGEAWALAALTHLRDPAHAEVGEEFLRRAGTGGGRFHLEAAIAAVHHEARRTGRTDDEALAVLYAALVTVRPTLGALVAQAAVTGRRDGPAAGLLALDALDPDAVREFQPWWATRAHLLATLDDPALAADLRAAHARALDLATDERDREFLLLHPPR